MTIVQVLILSVIQGACELLPVSSSAHVLVAAKLMGIDPSSPQMTFLLVMLHTGTMFAVIVYFWERWRNDYFSSGATLKTAKELVVASFATAVVGGTLLALIEKVFMHRQRHAEVESLFGNFNLIAVALAAVGILIVISGRGRQQPNPESTTPIKETLSARQSVWIGAAQGLCLPFRGFSRSGATISTGLVLGVGRFAAERFSFALAIVLTPPVIVRELLRLIKSGPSGNSFALGIVGMICSFVAGLLALRWLTRFLERGRWHWFGYYCLLAAIVVLAVARLV
jgi:undecaprenyl-diphosphatase